MVAKVTDEHVYILHRFKKHRKDVTSKYKYYLSKRKHVAGAHKANEIIKIYKAGDVVPIKDVVQHANKLFKHEGLTKLSKIQILNNINEKGAKRIAFPTLKKARRKVDREAAKKLRTAEENDKIYRKNLERAKKAAETRAANWAAKSQEEQLKISLARSEKAKESARKRKENAEIKKRKALEEAEDIEEELEEDEE